MKLKALIVDDEYPARHALRCLLRNFKNIEVLGEAANGLEALALVNALDYHVLFLDVSMPGMTGLELGAAIQELPKPPKIIFVTAHDEFAYKAFEVNAVDYLLKPVDPERLQKAIDKLTRACQKATGSEEIPGKEGGSQQPVPLIKIDRLPAENQGKTILVPESDIFYAFTEQDYIYIKTYQDKLVTRFTLKELEARLNPQFFFRTHRCYLVNLHKVKEIVPFFNGTYNLVVEDEEQSEVPVSRAQAKKLRKILGF